MTTKKTVQPTEKKIRILSCSSFAIVRAVPNRMKTYHVVPNRTSQQREGEASTSLLVPSTYSSSLLPRTHAFLYKNLKRTRTPYLLLELFFLLVGSILTHNATTIVANK
jgi:hypothetical protein